jgi:PEP-CTERM motif
VKHVSFISDCIRALVRRACELLSPATYSNLCMKFARTIRYTILLLGISSVAWAVPITVVNHSFEILPAGGLPNGCGIGCSYSVDFIPGWTNTPFLGLGLSSGQFRPGTDVGNTTYFNSLSDGPTSAYTTIPGIAQTVGATVQQGLLYTLLVDVGWRNDAAPFGVPRLKIDNVFYDGVGTPVRGGWATFTATYMGLAADVGKPITIFLDSATFQGNFDNVRLSDSSSAVVPEPSTLALFGVGFLGLCTLRRRKAKS